MLWLRAHVTMLVRLDAEETLRTMQAVGAAFAGGEGREEYVRSLTAHLPRSPRRRKRTGGDFRQFAADLGVPVVVEESGE